MSHHGLGSWAYVLYGFRVDASTVMAGWWSSAPQRRAVLLAAISIGSGIASLATVVVIGGVRYLRSGTGLAMALTAAVVVELAGVLLGGNYWSHYLIGLAPVLAVSAGVLAAEPAERWVRRFIVLPVVVTLLISAPAAVLVNRATAVTVTGQWLAQAAHPDDSLVVLYSHADLIHVSGLRPVYPYSWSLPVRTMDPDLTLLTSILRDPNRAPTWVVGWDDFNVWGLDRDGHLERALTENYVQAGVVCGTPIWLHRAVERDTPIVRCPATLERTG